MVNVKMRSLCVKQTVKCNIKFIINQNEILFSNCLLSLLNQSNKPIVCVCVFVQNVILISSRKCVQELGA